MMTEILVLSVVLTFHRLNTDCEKHTKMFAHHLLPTPVDNFMFITLLIISSVVVNVKSIDPEYSIENRVDHFLSASLNTVLSVLHVDKRPIDEEVTFWCSNR